MSMSTHVVGLVPPDETWLKMKAVWDACEAAEVVAPDEVLDFFDGIRPDKLGVLKDVPHREWRDEMREGFEVVLADLPQHVKVIRFWNSW